MALNINTNIGALGAAAAASQSARSMESAMERLASGLRINSAADDAAGVAISSRMEAQVRGLNQAIRNAGDGQSLVNTAEGAMTEITNMLQRIRELSGAAANGIMNAQDRSSLEAEVDQLVAEINRVATDTTFNNQRLLDGSYDGKFQIGMEAGQTVGVSIASMNASVLGREGNVPGATTQITSGSAEGTEATVTKATLALHGSDRFSFAVEGVSVSNATAIDPTNSTQLQQFATDINNALKAANNTEVVAKVSASGVLEFSNVKGDAISITNFASAGNGTASFTPLEGTGTARLLDDTAAVTSASAQGTVAASKGVTLRLEPAGAYSFKVNGQAITKSATESVADVASKIQTALGGTYVAIDATTTLDTTGTAAEKAAAALVTAAGNTFTSGTTTAAALSSAGANAAGLSVAATDILLYNTDTGTATPINITDFQPTDGTADGVQGTVRVVSPTAETVLVDGTNFFQAPADDTTKISEISMRFSSSQSDYNLEIDGQVFRIQAEKLADGTAGAAIIAAMNAATSDINGGQASAGGVGSLGNSNDDIAGTNATAATWTSGILDYAADERTDPFSMSIDNGVTFKTVTLGADATDQASTISALQTAIDTAFGSNVVKVEADGATKLKMTVVEKGAAYGISLKDLDAAVLTTTFGLTAAATVSNTANPNAAVLGAATGGINDLGRYNYEVVQNGLNITIKKNVSIATDAAATDNLRVAVENVSATITPATAFSTTIAASDTLETGDKVKFSADTAGLTSVGGVTNLDTVKATEYFVRRTGASTYSLHATASDANSNDNALNVIGTATAGSLVMVNGINATPGTNASEASFFVNNSSTAEEDTGTKVDLNAIGSGLYTSGTAIKTQMTLDFGGDDTFGFTLANKAGVAGSTNFSAAVLGGSVATMIAHINASTANTGVVASAVTGSSSSVLLTKDDGTAITLTNFAATNKTSVVASPATGQGSSVELDQTTPTVAADIAAAGLADETKATLKFSGQDEVSMKVSDGTSVGLVRFTNTHTNNGADLKAELDKALIGMDVTATVVKDGSGNISVNFVNANGGKIEISDFATKGTAFGTFTPNVLQGNAVIMNDDSAVTLSGKAIADISFSTQDGATEAFGIVDRALQTINDMRSELGAVSNRLDHTISNLTNVVINTESAKSRIMDADFAAESTQLAKSQILQQASMAMLAQANASKQGVLSLLQG
jgi:flagellin